MELTKMYYTMGEVSEMFDVKPSLLRYWEGQFSELKPKKNKKGNRLFTPKDIEWLKLIYHLVKERGMTLEGARKSLKQNKPEISRDSELLERLQRVRALLVEVREELKSDDEELLVQAEESVEPLDDEPVKSEPLVQTKVEVGPDEEPKPKTKRRRGAQLEPTQMPVIAQPVEPEAEPQEQPEEPVVDSLKVEVNTVLKPEPKLVVERPARRGRPKKERKPADKELFAFYEQSLFQSSNED